MSHDFPVIFTIGNSSRHEVILVNPGFSIEDISSAAEKFASSSVNCQETLSKYKKQGETEKVTGIKVRWASEGRDEKLFPKKTVITEENIEGILKLIGLGGSKDVLEIDMQAPQSSKPDKESEETKETKEIPERTK